MRRKEGEGGMHKGTVRVKNCRNINLKKNLTQRLVLVRLVSILEMQQQYDVDNFDYSYEQNCNLVFLPKNPRCTCLAVHVDLD